jgi:hypothetical protein
VINSAYYPRNEPVPPIGLQVVQCFRDVEGEISSAANDHLIGAEYRDSASNTVLAKLRLELESRGFKVERGKTQAGGLSVLPSYS